MKQAKLLSMLLAFCMLLFLFAGCGNTTESAENPDTGIGESTDTGISDSVNEGASDESAEELPAYKIGIISHTTSGGCWDRILDAAEYLGDALNCEIVTAVGSSADAILTEAENFIAAGVDGIITLNDGGVTSRLVDICEDANVYLVFSDCGYSSYLDDDYADYASNPYFLGHVAHDEYADAYACASDMIANGAENFVIFGLPPGIASNFDQHTVGAIDAINDAGLDAPVEARSYTMAELASNLMSQYPDTDAIFSFVTTSQYFNTLEMAEQYGGKIQVSAYMEGDVTEEFESGFLTHVSIGSEARIELSFALLYSALRGTRIENEDGTAPNILFPHLWITSAEDFATFYSATTGGNHAYSLDEVEQLIAAFNSDVSVSDYETLAAEFSTTWLSTK